MREIVDISVVLITVTIGKRFFREAGGHPLVDRTLRTSERDETLGCW